MKKTLLLCFIHGFKGDDYTFGSFPEYLKVIVNHALPNINVRAVVYPRYETRGDLEVCVKAFKEWLLEKVIDLEVENGSPSPTVNPSVRLILIGHSMGGIVAVETALSITLDQPVNLSSSPTDSQPMALNKNHFPYIQGILAFDTPYLGISPGVLAHLSPPLTTLTQLRDVSSILWGSKSHDSSTKLNKNIQNESDGLNSTKAVASRPWAKIAAIAGASIVLAAGGATAAYMNKDSISQNCSWVSSHLKFISCLMKHEELQKRIEGMVTLNSKLGIGFGNIYTRLGINAIKKSTSVNRTFCILPKTEEIAFWHEAVNDDAEDETSAHTAMFYPRKNPGYYNMSQMAKSLITDWTTDKWFSSNLDP